MVGMKKQSHWWWFEGHNSPRRSPWLQSTLSELDKKTKAMLKLIEEDADSFAQRAEMYYKKRPELITMVEDFYRSHRSLAERFDQVKSDSGPRIVTTTTLGSPVPFTRYKPEYLKNIVDQSYDSYSETFDPEDSDESEVDDPEHEDEVEADNEMEEEEISSGVVVNEEVVMKLREEMERLIKEKNETQKLSSGVVAIEEKEVMKLREEIERLKEENGIQKDQLMQKDEEKREVIRQLSLAVEMVKNENLQLRKCIAAAAASAKESSKKWSPLEFTKLKGIFLGKFFSGSSKPETSVVAL